MRLMNIKKKHTGGVLVRTNCRSHTAFMYKVNILRVLQERKILNLQRIDYSNVHSLFSDENTTMLSEDNKHHCIAITL